MEIHAGRCGSASGFSSWPITRASVTATPVPTMEATSGGTRTKTSTTCAFRQRTVRAWSYSAGAEIKSLRRRDRHTTRKVEIEAHSPMPRPPAASKRRRSRSSTSAPSPRWNAALPWTRAGEQFTMPLFEGAAIRHDVGGPKRARVLRNGLHDGERLVSVTDVNGYEQIALAACRRVERGVKLVTKGDIGRVTGLAASGPTSAVIAFTNHRHELCALDLDDGEVRVLDTCPTHRIDRFGVLARRTIRRVCLVAGARNVDRTHRQTAFREGSRRHHALAHRSVARLGSRRKVSIFHLDARFQSGLRCAAVRPKLSAGQPPVRRDAARRRTVAVRPEA